MTKIRIRRDTVLRRLIAARDLISKKKNWLRGRSAAREDGTGTPIHSKSAISFCATGAIRRVTRVDRQRTGSSVHANEALRRLASALPSDAPISGGATDRIQGFNDQLDLSESRTVSQLETSKHRRVVAVFNRAIKTLEAELS